MIWNVRKVPNNNVKLTGKGSTHVMLMKRDPIDHTMGSCILPCQGEAFVFHINGDTNRRWKRMKERHDHGSTAHTEFKDMDRTV